MRRLLRRYAPLLYVSSYDPALLSFLSSRPGSILFQDNRKASQKKYQEDKYLKGVFIDMLMKYFADAQPSQNNGKKHSGRFGASQSDSA